MFVVDVKYFFMDPLERRPFVIYCLANTVIISFKRIH